MKIFRSLVLVCLLGFGTEALGASYGWNFRSTQPFVTDPAGSTYVIDVGGGFASQYPTTRNGITFGWTVQPGNLRDRNAALDPRLAGIHFSTSGSGTFRVDLPNTGTWTVDLALGDPGGGATALQSTIYDNVTARTTIGPIDTSSGQFVDAAGTTHASAAAWVASHQTINVNFTTTTFFITLDRALASIGHLTLSSGPPDSEAPTAPTSPSATAISAQEITSGWTNGTDNVSILNTRIERCATAGCVDFAEVGTSTSTSFANTGLSPSTLYRFRYRHFDGTNLGPYTAIVEATTSDISQATVTWDDDLNTDQTGYVVQRRTQAGSFADLASLGTASARQYIDPDSPLPVACYRVRAVRSGEDGPQSSEACTVSPLSPAPGTHLYGALLTGKIQIVP